MIHVAISNLSMKFSFTLILSIEILYDQRKDVLLWINPNKSGPDVFLITKYEPPSTNKSNKEMDHLFAYLDDKRLTQVLVNL